MAQYTGSAFTLMVGLLYSLDASILNMEELNSIHYNIDIQNTPVVKDENLASDVFEMTNKYGQQYSCKLPPVYMKEKDSKKEEDPLDLLVDISELLKPMEQAPCLIKKKDWWTYEFCYGSNIFQYHSEDEKIYSNTLTLGLYESEYNWINSSEAKNKLKKFHSQFYVNGTRCDITGEHRRTEVRFVCEEGAGDYIQRVDEPESCRYVFVVATTRLCHHPYLRVNPNRISHEIICAPSFSKEQLDQYEDMRQKKTSIELIQGEKEEIEDDNFSVRFFTIPVAGKNANLALKEESILIAQESHDDSYKNILKEFITAAEKIEQSVDDDNFPYMSKGRTKKKLNLDEKDIKDLDSESDGNGDVDLENNGQRVHAKNKESRELIKEKLHKLLSRWKEIQSSEMPSLDNTDSMQDMYEKFESLRDTGNSLLDSTLAIIEKEIADLASEVGTDYAINSGDKNMDDSDPALQRNMVDDVYKTLEGDLKSTEEEVQKAKNKLQQMNKFLKAKIDQELKRLAELDHGGESNRWRQSDPKAFLDNLNQQRTLIRDIENDEGDVIPSIKNMDVDSSETVMHSKLETGIRERLQKHGLNKIARKIEVKILTATPDDNEKDTLSSLTDEQANAFQDMVVNILSANAEELQERERHMNLEKNYKLDISSLLNENNEDDFLDSNTYNDVDSNTDRDNDDIV